MLKPKHIGVTIEPYGDGLKMVAGADIRCYELIAGRHVYAKLGDSFQAFDAVAYHKDRLVRRLRHEVYGELDRPLRETLALARSLSSTPYRDGLPPAERVAVLIQEVLDLMTFKPEDVARIQVRERPYRESHDVK